MGPIADPIGERLWRPTTRPALVLALLALPLLAVAGIVLQQRQPDLPPMSPLPAVFPTSGASSYSVAANPWSELAASQLPMMMLPTAPAATDEPVAPAQPFVTAAAAPLPDAPTVDAATAPSVAPANPPGSRVETPAPPVVAEPPAPQSEPADLVTAASEEREQQLLRGERHDANGGDAPMPGGAVAANAGPAVNLAAALSARGPRVAAAAPASTPTMSPLALVVRQAAAADDSTTTTDPAAEDPGRRAMDAGLVHKAPDPPAAANANARGQALGGASSHGGAKNGGGHQ